ncbi:hypothetical protein KX928_23430 [Roseobacter sp. YSTF-M11]|uniref:Uncharacterized protein n=1 Tax=Roseobacter insulae TaxID=2859783 RepID=A0A9X1G1B5_9RHOB|nr:hypothetical protein [Roseobacter insulae]MBW4710753.1 hypothetical protein [Roseobacter insulae]
MTKKKISDRDQPRKSGQVTTLVAIVAGALAGILFVVMIVTLFITLSGG